jgi:hypothetical protein
VNVLEGSTIGKGKKNYRFQILPFATTREALVSVLRANTIYCEDVGMRGAFFFAPLCLKIVVQYTWEFFTHFVKCFGISV